MQKSTLKPNLCDLFSECRWEEPTWMV